MKPHTTAAAPKIKVEKKTVPKGKLGFLENDSSIRKLAVDEDERTIDSGFKEDKVEKKTEPNGKLGFSLEKDSSIRKLAGKEDGGTS